MKHINKFVPGMYMKVVVLFVSIGMTYGTFETFVR